MILPGSHTEVVLLLFLGMLCWGIWANTYKAAEEKWRYELYCFDFAIGMVLAALAIGLTLGNLGFDGFSFLDDLRLGGKKQELFGFCAGCIFNLGNMLLLGAVSLAGMALAFPIAMSVALAFGVLWSYLLNSGPGPALLFVGAAVALGAAAAAVFSYHFYSAERAQAAAAPGSSKSSRRKKKPGSTRAIVMGLAGGLMLGCFAPSIQQTKVGEIGLGPYATGFVFALGVFFSTFVFNLFFMNLPVKGAPIEMREFLRAKVSRHGKGILGGIIWYIGAIAMLIAGRVEGAARVQASVVYAFSQGGAIIAIVCGLYFWKELGSADMRVKTYLGVSVALLAIGIGLVSVASVAPAW